MNLQIETLDPNRLWEVSPEGGAYGALIVVFVVAIVVLYKKLTKLEGEYKEVINTAHEVSKESVIALKEIQNKQDLNVKTLEGHFNRIIDKLDNLNKH